MSHGAVAALDPFGGHDITLYASVGKTQFYCQHDRHPQNHTDKGRRQHALRRAKVILLSPNLGRRFYRTGPDPSRPHLSHQHCLLPRNLLLRLLLSIRRSFRKGSRRRRHTGPLGPSESRDRFIGSLRSGFIPTPLVGIKDKSQGLSQYLFMAYGFGPVDRPVR